MLRGIARSARVDFRARAAGPDPSAGCRRSPCRCSLENGNRRPRKISSRDHRPIVDRGLFFPRPKRRTKLQSQRKECETVFDRQLETERVSLDEEWKDHSKGNPIHQLALASYLFVLFRRMNVCQLSFPHWINTACSLERRYSECQLGPRSAVHPLLRTCLPIPTGKNW